MCTSQDTLPTSACCLGTNGRWRDVLTPNQLERYEEVMRSKLTPECIQWLTCGSFCDS